MVVMCICISYKKIILVCKGDKEVHTLATCTNHFDCTTIECESKYLQIFNVIQICNKLYII